MNQFKKLLPLGLFIIFLPGSIALAQPDTVKVAASLKYAHPSLIKTIFLGSNYRKEWRTLASLPVFRLDETHGGFKITELGGGEQTTSLHLEDSAGNDWALRTVDKNVEKALPPELRNTMAERVVQDMISAAHPYGAAAIPTLSRAAGVIAGAHEYYYVPDDPALGEYRSLFAHSVCLLVHRDATPDGSESLDTEEMEEELANGAVLDRKALLRARLLDMLIGDWDRHEDQWRWGKTETDDGRSLIYPLPRDRDQAFFFADGLVPKITALVAMPELRGFAPTTNGLKQLNRKAWEFDARYLSAISRNEWEKETKQFCSALNDSLLQAAVQRMPPEIYKLSGKEIEKKLRDRRDGLLEASMRYFDFLFKQ